MLIGKALYLYIECAQLSTRSFLCGSILQAERHLLLHDTQLGSAAQMDYGLEDFQHTHSRQPIYYLVIGTHYTQAPLNLSIMTHHILKRTQVGPLCLYENLIS